MSTSITGTGTITLGSALDGFFTFAEAGAQDADVVSYTIEDGNDVEIGTGTYTASGTTLSRDAVTESKIGGTAGTSKINLSGNATVFLTARAEDFARRPTFGVNADADTTNRLSVTAPAALFNRETDDIQVKLNKEAAGDTASFLFQTNFAGFAEIGLTGDDDFHFKVSPDNFSTTFEGLTIDKDNGQVTLPQRILTINGLAAGSAQIVLGEDADNGTDTATIQAPASISSSFTLTLPGATGTLLSNASTATLGAGFAHTPDKDGTQSSGTYTPDEAGGNMKRIVNGGAFALAPPTNDCCIIVQITNNGSAGAITTSGFSAVFGDSFTTTNGDDFICTIIKINGFSSLTVQDVS
jgi:hypothetical protein